MHINAAEAPLATALCPAREALGTLFQNFHAPSGRHNPGVSPVKTGSLPKKRDVLPRLPPWAQIGSCREAENVLSMSVHPSQMDLAGWALLFVKTSVR